MPGKLGVSPGERRGSRNLLREVTRGDRRGGRARHMPSLKERRELVAEGRLRAEKKIQSKQRLAVPKTARRYAKTASDDEYDPPEL